LGAGRFQPREAIDTLLTVRRRIWSLADAIVFACESVNSLRAQNPGFSVLEVESQVFIPSTSRSDEQKAIATATSGREWYSFPLKPDHERKNRCDRRADRCSAFRLRSELHNDPVIY
jgi:hypothetical protein